MDEVEKLLVSAAVGLRDTAAESHEAKRGIESQQPIVPLLALKENNLPADVKLDAPEQIDNILEHRRSGDAFAVLHGVVLSDLRNEIRRSGTHERLSTRRTLTGEEITDRLATGLMAETHRRANRLRRTAGAEHIDELPNVLRIVNREIRSYG